ncbi:MoaD/ThiS family protein [Aureivirga marina]|uniref:MoaD/ThiS family protein n=1 Tax=Aureivirga marina TaxID=1182451 RepID=UPI0018CB2112|nr:MoaD/ThiS family protein [Aureivirga marina]
MEITILTFGILSDLLEKEEFQVQLTPEMNVLNFKQYLLENFSKLNGYSNFSVAINETYASDDTIIKEKDIIALIPPVSGG